jgi:hypothetical protein
MQCKTLMRRPEIRPSPESVLHRYGFEAAAQIAPKKLFTTRASGR